MLIFMLIFAWSYFSSPSPEQVKRQQEIQDSIKKVQDSIANAQLLQESNTKTNEETAQSTSDQPVLNDSLKNLQLYAKFGSFAASASGTERLDSLENEVFKVIFTNKGGRIKEVQLKDYQKLTVNEEREEVKSVLKLLEDQKNRFEYTLPVRGAAGGVVNTADLYFEVKKTNNEIAFRAPAGDGRYFEQKYTISNDNYSIDYDINLNGLNEVVRALDKGLKLKWVNYLDRIEHNTSYERNYSSIYYKPVDDGVDYCSCTSDDEEDADNERLAWISNSNQFFNSTLIADGNFRSADMAIELTPEDSPDLKKLTSDILVPIGGDQGTTANMTFYIGPNKYERLAAFDNSLQDIIPYGSSIFGTVNRWVIRPIFNFLSSFIGSAGIVILVLTLLVKLVLYPLTYKMLYSQSKMGALKPRITALKDKFGDDQQQQQMETMKLYREFGVNPLGGCLPVVLQMPIWFALYRFFPASIEFRQASFLWATDLSSYDVFTYLPFNIPFYGEHISLFTLLWAVTTVIYTYYNTKHMDMSVNPAMKYMQYLMPFMFLFFFNNFASGLSCYLFFSTVLNVLQTIVTKNYIIDQEKIKKELEDYRKKPKKKGGFQQRLEAAMKDAQKQQELRKKKKK